MYFRWLSSQMSRFRYCFHSACTASMCACQGKEKPIAVVWEARRGAGRNPGGEGRERGMKLR